MSVVLWFERTAKRLFKEIYRDSPVGFRFQGWFLGYSTAMRLLSVSRLEARDVEVEDHQVHEASVVGHMERGNPRPRTAARLARQRISQS